jgi:hypothetical protein
VALVDELQLVLEQQDLVVQTPAPLRIQNQTIQYMDCRWLRLDNSDASVK